MVAAKNLKPMNNLEMISSTFADKVRTESNETGVQQRIWGEKKNSLVKAENS